MNDPRSIQIADAIEESLKGIMKDTGSFTDLGVSVKSGFWMFAVNEKGAKFPLLAIQPTKEGGSERTGTRKVISAIIPSTIHLVVVARLHDDGVRKVRLCLADIRKAMANIHAYVDDKILESPIELGEAEYSLDESSKYLLAGIPVTFSFIENYEG